MSVSVQWIATCARLPEMGRLVETRRAGGMGARDMRLSANGAWYPVASTSPVDYEPTHWREIQEGDK